MKKKFKKTTILRENSFQNKKIKENYNKIFYQNKKFDKIQKYLN